ncbi:CYTH and CHAD domain-containing protein [Tsukamurella sp. 8F]|uniref:CYTH and CHAD domain-containing protein n=1 Tax=unclassified Tsukamurella TaxID=2633480 RepID=UPI0023B8C707|nr:MULTISPECIES: CYTH and CHAD domain-containing protein [unclassified Tsukamurella]MDF0529945.1 CYTH and CHAD domain-containing protein [Tsukamurella sp. 8J]MDF0587283.1 CYTH and CHAD domain-containing protein [Tsukamurella sp. 8F]
MGEQLEIETKYEVDDAVAAPDLTNVPGVASTSTDEVFHLNATYFDTEALDLASRRITLRRRLGGKDDGWHLKLPAGDERREVTVPLLAEDGSLLGADDVPAELATRVLVYTRLRPLVPIAIVENERHTTYAHAPDGEALGELADDHVHTISLLPGGDEKTWREWEFEVPDTDGGRATAVAVGRALKAAGAHEAHSASKLARAIDSEPEAPAPSLPRKAKASRAPASRLLVAALARSRDRLLTHDPLVRARADDAVHQMRVATRQLRSILSEYGAYFAGPSPAALSTELRSLAVVLGGVRDAEVLVQRFTGLAQVEPSLSGAATLLADRQAAQEVAAWDRVDAYLTSDRYFALLDAVDATIDDPPTTKRAAKAAEDTVVPLLRKRIRTFAKDATHVLTAPGATDRDVHAVRKRAKKLRYAAAVPEPALDKQARQSLTGLAAVQQRLGEFQDAHIARDAIAAVDIASLDAATAFELGRLDAIEERRTVDARAALPGLLRRLR